MSNLIEIQSQIEKLTKQANEIRAREFDKTVQDILAKMKAFGIGLKDIQLEKSSKAAKGRTRRLAASVPKKSSTKAKNKNIGGVVAAKFRGPNGESWSGRGLMPRWLSALVAQGKSKEDFAIKS